MTIDDRLKKAMVDKARTYQLTFDDLSDLRTEGPNASKVHSVFMELNLQSSFFTYETLARLIGRKDSVFLNFIDRVGQDKKNGIQKKKEQRKAFDKEMEAWATEKGSFTKQDVEDEFGDNIDWYDTFERMRHRFRSRGVLQTKYVYTLLKR